MYNYINCLQRHFDISCSVALRKRLLTSPSGHFTFNI